MSLGCITVVSGAVCDWGVTVVSGAVCDWGV